MGASGEWVVKQGHEANFFAAWTAPGSQSCASPLGATNVQRPASRVVAK
jgi:hypothetical protein